jgi:broad specificity phosphatase PhoE
VGRAQAAELRRTLEASGVRFDLLVTTPLSRAIETADAAFGGIADRFLATPELTETASERLGGPQRGVNVAALREKYRFLESWDLSNVREGDNWLEGEPSVLGGVGYYHPKPVEERLDGIKAWLKSLPHERVVVVGHSGVFDRLLGLQMANCQLVEHEL